jgi:hypothetical protein
MRGRFCSRFLKKTRYIFGIYPQVIGSSAERTSEMEIRDTMPVVLTTQIPQLKHGTQLAEITQDGIHFYYL